MKPNIYHDLTKICDTCGFPIVNNNSHWGKRCWLPDGGPRGKNKQRSPCQLSNDARHAKAARKKRRAEGLLNDYKYRPIQQPDEDMRKCIGVKCMDKSDEDRKFLSTSPTNRQCEECLAASQGFSTKGLSRIGAPIEGLKFL